MKKEPLCECGHLPIRHRHGACWSTLRSGERCACKAYHPVPAPTEKKARAPEARR